MTKTQVLGAMVSLSALMIGCGSGGGVNSGVDKSKIADETTPEEAEKVCRAVLDYVSDRASSIDPCKITGLVGGSIAYAQGGTDDEIREACNAAVDSCKEAGGEAPNTPDPDTTCNDAQIPDCDATVGDIETCTAEQVDAQLEFYEKLPDCSGLDRAYIESQEEMETPEPSATCKSVAEKCPAFSGLGG